MLFGKRVEKTDAALPGPSPLSRWARRAAILSGFLAAFCAGFAAARHKVRGDLKIIRVTPSGEVCPAEMSRVEIEFGEPLDPETAGPGAIRLVPCAEGSARLEKGRILVFELSEKLKRASRYRVLLSQEIRGLNGEPVRPGEIEFTTTPLAVLEAFQSDFKLHDYSEISLRFNAPVVPEELAKHLELSDGEGRKLGFTLGGFEPGETVLVRVPQPETDQVEVRVFQGLAGSEGPLPLEGDFEAKVTVSRALRLLSMEAGWDDSSPVVRVRMNESVQPSEAASFLKIDPPVRFSCHHHYSGFRIEGGFEAGRRYRITLRPGLPAGDAGVLKDEASRTVWFPDVPETFAFGQPGSYLSPEGMLTVPVRSTNVEELNLRAWRLYPSNIPEYVLRGSKNCLEDLGTLLAERKIAVRGERNAGAETLLRLRDFAGPEPRGVFLLETTSPACRWRRERKLVVATDLGISARVSKAELLLWVNSIATAGPIGGVEATLFSSKRQVLGSAVTDADGIARIALGETAGDETPSLVTARRGADLSYLLFEGCGRQRKDSGEGGRPFLARGYEAYCFADRGVFRPGDEVRLSAFLRGVEGATPPLMPVEIRVVRPDGAELTTLPAMTDPGGAVTASLRVPREAPLGYYQVKLGLPGASEAVGRTFFSVAEYVPPTLEMKFETPSGPVFAGETARVRVEVGNLFGAPASGLKVRARARFIPSPFGSSAWEGYVFGSAGEGGGKLAERRCETRTDPGGKAVLELRTPGAGEGALARAEVELEAIDPGGRALVKQASFLVYSAKTSLGMLPPQTAPQAGSRFTLKTAAVECSGKALDSEAPYVLTVDRVTWSYVLKRNGRRGLSYEWTSGRERVFALERRFAQGQDEPGILLEDPGTYEMTVESAGCTPARCTVQVRGPGLPWVSEDPEALAVALDRRSYRPGETARIRLTGPFGGRALVCLEKDAILSWRLVEMPAGEAEFTEVVSEAWRPNVFVTATLLRPASHEQEWRPHLACGSALLKLDDADRRLKVSVSHAEEVRPARPFEVRVAVLKGGEPAADASVILAAVDEGVLDMTGHRTPDPAGFFHGTRRLEIREFDLYSDLAPELSSFRVCAVSEPGGDEAKSLEAGGFLNPVQVRRVRTAALFAGPLRTGADGTVSHVFEMPEFTGRLRVMAVAAQGPCFGASGTPLRVASPVVVKASWPRFLAPGDAIDLPVTVWNRTAAEAELRIRLSLEGPLEALDREGTLGVIAPGGEKLLFLRVKALSAGRARARVTAEAGAESCTDSVELAVRPGAAFSREGETATVEPGGAVEFGEPRGWLEGTAKASLFLGGTPAVELSGALGYLLDYPYGCLEQTTSRLVPLVYLRDLAAVSAPESVAQEDLDELLKAGFERLSLMRTPSGGLSLWPGGNEPDAWASAYAADLLVEARKAGYAVPEALLENLLAYLSKNAGGWIEAEDPQGRPRMLHEASYAVFVLARAGRPAFGAMARLEEEFRANAGFPPSASAMLAASLALSGQREAGMALLQRGPRFSDSVRGGGMASPVREAALMLSVMLDLDPENGIVPVLVNRLRQKVRLGRWGTTQENAFALQALGKLARRMGPAAGGKAVVSFRDGSEKSFDLSAGARLSGDEALSAVSVRVEGGSRAFVFRETRGVPATGAAVEEDSGLAARRSFLSADGSKAVDPRLLKQGDLYRVRLSLQAGCSLENVVVADLLPAGVEIFRVRADREGGEARRVTLLSPIHAEARDDRLLLFCSIDGGGAAEYDYLVRAVTPGEFVLPALDASCMYDPGVFSVNGRGRVTVTRAGGD